LEFQNQISIYEFGLRTLWTGLRGLVREYVLALDSINQPNDLLSISIKEHASQLSIRCEFNRHWLPAEFAIPPPE
jgi:hypothetical protein